VFTPTAFFPCHGSTQHPTSREHTAGVLWGLDHRAPLLAVLLTRVGTCDGVALGASDGDTPGASDARTDGGEQLWTTIGIALGLTAVVRWSTDPSGGIERVHSPHVGASLVTTAHLSSVAVHHCGEVARTLGVLEVGILQAVDGLHHLVVAVELVLLPKPMSEPPIPRRACTVSGHAQPTWRSVHSRSRRHLQGFSAEDSPDGCEARVAPSLLHTLCSV